VDQHAGRGGEQARGGEHALSTQLERLIRYCHPDKLLDGLGLQPPDLPKLYGAAPETCRRLAAAARDEAVAAAAGLGARPLPFRPGARILAVGDSHTDDIGSWAHILAALHDGPVLNAGVSGDTTIHVRARVDRLPRADEAIVLVGTNDARRHGGSGSAMLVSHDETRRNVRAIQRALRGFCGHVTWITPPPVDERRLAVDPLLDAAGVSWRLADVAAKAAVIADEFGDAIDLWPVFGSDHLTGDGLHPSPAGQRLIVEALVASAARASAPRTA
jgi:acyl-CoA thioesterase I